MRIEFDPEKRALTLAHRGLDMADAWRVFQGHHTVSADERHDYAEERFVTAGFLGPRMVVLVWTRRGDARRIISMRHANERERKRYAEYLD